MPERRAPEPERLMSQQPEGEGDRPYRAGRRDYDDPDPLAGFAGAPPARSALTLRLVLAAFGLLFCVAAAVGTAIWRAWLLMAALIILGLVALVDLVVVVRGTGRGGPG
jgi:hypothetical protein